MERWVKPLAAALLLPLALAGCLFQPGKFDATMTIHADRSFTFAYKGEVLAADIGDMSSMMSGMGTMKPADDDKEAKPDPAKEAQEKAEKDAQMREVAAQLSNEAGYRSVTYQGDGKFLVDYEISGVLTHNFVFPFNLDANMLLPWVAVELRGKDGARMKAPGFVKQDSGQTGGMSSGDSKADGTFTLVTDAEVVSQNDETGPEVAGATRTYRWRITPRSSDAPMAVLRLKPL